MQAATVIPGQPDGARVDDVPEPAESDGAVLVDGLLVGVCGTDYEITHSGYGWTPPGRDRLVLFHESLGRVRSAPEGSGLAAGDLVVGVVRRPCGHCGPCAGGEWDFCRTGDYTERGIKQRDGYGSRRWRIEPDFAVRLDGSLDRLGVLTEPASVVAKAWDQVDRIGARAYFQPETVLVTGAGPIGLLAALIGVQRGLDVHVLDRVTGGRKPDLVRQLGATYHAGSTAAAAVHADVVIECTGVGEVVFDVLQETGRNAITCLTGISGARRTVPISADAINKELVLDNDVVFGSVNANRRHYQLAAAALAAADKAWLTQLVTRTVPLASWPDALRKQDDDVKVVVDLQA